MQQQLDRRLGLFDLVCLVMGAIVGVGIFWTPRSVVAITGSGPLALTAWALGGVIAILGALTFAELGGLFPRTGGQYVVLKTAFGRPVAFLYGWALLSVIQSGAIGIIAILAVKNIAVLTGHGAYDDRTATTMAAVLIGGLTLVNVLGVRQGAILTNVTLILKSATILGVAAIGIFGSTPDTPAATAATHGDGSWYLVFPAIIPILFAVGGWQQGLYVAGEVKNPARNLPIGIIVGVIGVTVLYLSINVGAVRLLGVDRLASSQSPAVDVVTAMWPGLAPKLVAAAIAVSAIGVANVCILTAPRMYKAMAEDGVFFRSMGEVQSRFGTPAIALALQGGVAVLLVVIAGEKRVDQLLTGVVCIDCVFFILTGIALFRLRKIDPGAPRPFRVPGYPLVPALFVLAEIGALVASIADAKTRAASRISLLVLGSGLLFYLWFVRRRLRDAVSP